MEERDRWIRLIKDLRIEHNISLPDAEKMALTRPEWRRWVQRQIDSDLRCKRMARRHIEYRGEDALLERQGDRFVLRDPL
jgi:hypothetical protein